MRFTNQNFKHVFCWLNLLERKGDQHMDKLLMMTFDVFGINWVFVLLSADDGAWWGGSTWVWAQEVFLSKLCLFSQAGLKHPHHALCPNRKNRRGRLCLPLRLLTLSKCPCLIWLEGHWMIEAKFLTCLDRDIATNSMPEWCQFLCLLSFLLSFS